MTEGMEEQDTLPVFAWVMKRETVTVAVLLMYPTLVTWPMNDMGGILRYCKQQQAEDKESG